jgi:hypothetical protein
MWHVTRQQATYGKFSFRIRSCTALIFFYFLQFYNLLYKLSNKQICYKETLVRSKHPMMMLLCILYATLLPLSGPLSQRAIAVLVCV